MVQDFGSKFRLHSIFRFYSSFLVIACIFLFQVVHAQEKFHTGIFFYQDSVLDVDQMKYRVFIKRIAPNSSASKTDIRPGDKLVNINGIKCGDQKKDISKMDQLMECNQNTTLSIELEREESKPGFPDGGKKTTRKTYVLECEPMKAINNQKIFGIGVTLNVDSIFIHEQLTYVAKIQVVYPYSPAEMMGMQSGDFIVKVDGHSVDEKRPEVVQQIIDLILMYEPKQIDLTFVRKTEEGLVSFEGRARRTDISKYINLGIQNFPTLIRANQKEELTQDEKLSRAINDRDGDGIINKEDACPDEAGKESLNPFENGCPER